MEPVTVYARNGATFTCRTKERLKHYLAAGWTDKPPRKGRKPKDEQPKDDQPKDEQPKDDQPNGEEA